MATETLRFVGTDSQGNQVTKDVAVTVSSGLVVEYGYNNGAPWAPTFNNGVQVSGGGPDTPQRWKAVNASLKGKWRRSFHSSLPTTFAQHTAAGDAALGIKSVPSVKCPGAMADTANGVHDSRWKTFLETVPAGTKLIVNHEPQPEHSAAVYVDAISHVYQLKEQVKPGIEIGTGYTEYRFGMNGSSLIGPETADISAWDLGDNIDFNGIDFYAEPWKSGNPPKLPMQHTGFARWYNYFSTKPKPLAICEISLPLEWRQTGGGDPYHGTILGSYTDSVRAKWYDDTLTWVESTGKFNLVLLWHNDYYGHTEPADSYINTMTSMLDGRTAPLTLAAWNKHAGP